MRYFIVLLFASALSSIAAASPATGKTPEELSPCSGWNAETGSFFPTGSSWCHMPAGDCPRGFALTSVLAAGGDRYTPSSVSVRGHCCKLPDGILTDDHIFVLDHCPEDFVATGAKSAEGAMLTGDEKRMGCTSGWALADQYLRCTRIDTKHYRLSAPSSAVNVGWAKHFSYMNAPVTTRSRIPAALRYSVGRTGPFSWDNASCVPLAFGSVLTAKSNKYCSGFSFRRILYRTSEPGSTENSPVPIFPECDRLEPRFDAFPKCVKSALQK